MLGKYTTVEVQGQASVPALKQYLYCAEAQGVDYLPLLEMAGVDSAILKDNNRSISNNAMQRLVILLARPCHVCKKL